MPEADFIKKLSPFFLLLKRYFRYEAVGLQNIPGRGPSLLLMNHGVLPFHAFILIYEIFSRRDILVRSLTADFLFEIPLLREMLLKGGAVRANHKNAERLLKEGHVVTVAPGGIYEALVTRPWMKRIPWERRFGFAEVACQAKVPIIPTYCHGINETYLNSKFLLRRRIKLLEKYRFSLPLFFGIGLLPFPVKLTHVIGRPISTKARRGEAMEKRVQRVHDEVVGAMEQLRDHKEPT